MSLSPTPHSIEEEPIRIRPRRRTRPRRIGPLLLPFWWLGRRTRRIRPWLWRISQGMGLTGAFGLMGINLLQTIFDVKLPEAAMRYTIMLFVVAMGEMFVLRTIEAADTPEDWSPPDVRWMLPHRHY